MALVDLNCTGGVNNTTYGTPSISRTTSVPTSESYTACAWIKVISDPYVDFLHFFASEGSPQSRSMFVEGNINGDVYNYENTGGTTADYWIDDDNGWNFLASVGRTANIIGYWLRAGTWTTTGTITSPAGAHDRMSWGSQFQFAADASGRHLVRSLRIWNVELTLQEIKAESQSVKPRRLSGLTFWTSCLIPASFNVDLSGTGGNFTMNGAAASSQDDPGIPWQRNRTYSYAW